MEIPYKETALKLSNSESLCTQIIGQIRSWIIEGHLKEGDLLPSERTLAEMFQVSRIPVNQALRILEFLGVVQHIRGKGTCVKKIDVNRILSNIGFLALPQGEMRDLLEAQEALDVQASRLAARRRTDEDLTAIEDALLEMNRNMAMKRDVTNAAGRFHTAVMKASGNVVLIEINAFLSDLLRYSREQVLRDIALQRVALDQHREIYQAIKKQDFEKAGIAMQLHLRDLYKILI